MSYDIQVFRQEVKERYRQYATDDFFEQESNFLEFTKEQNTMIHQLLSASSFKSTGQYTFVHQQEAAIVELSSSTLYCSANTGKGIDALYQFLNLLLENSAFLKFDPQDKGWD